MVDDDTPPDEQHSAHQTSAPFVTDAELIRRIGVPEKIARQVIRALDANPKSGFPPKIKMWGNRRYWPAVLAYLDRLYGLGPIVKLRSAAASKRPL